MKHLITSISVTGLMLFGIAAYADDAATPSTAMPSATTPVKTTPAATPASPMTSRHQLMKDCMVRQKAADSSMSKAAMKKTCKEQVKAQVEYSTAPTSP